MPYYAYNQLLYPGYIGPEKVPYFRAKTGQNKKTKNSKKSPANTFLYKNSRFLKVKREKFGNMNQMSKIGPTADEKKEWTCDSSEYNNRYQTFSLLGMWGKFIRC